MHMCAHLPTPNPISLSTSTYTHTHILTHPHPHPHIWIITTHLDAPFLTPLSMGGNVGLSCFVGLCKWLQTQHTALTANALRTEE